MFQDLCIIPPGSDKNVNKKTTKKTHIWGKVRKNSWTLLLSGSHQKLTGFYSGPRSKFCENMLSGFFVWQKHKQPTVTNQPNKQTDKQTHRHGWQHNLTGGGNKHIHLLPLSSLVLSHPYRTGRGSRNGAKMFGSELLMPTFILFWMATNLCMWLADSGHRSLTWIHF